MSRRGSRDEGQAAVELALVLPLVALLLLLVVQVGLVARDQVLVVHAAREAARQAAVDGDVGAIRRAAAETPGLDGGGVEVEVKGRGGPGSHVAVEVRYRRPARVPIVGVAIGGLHLQATATMRVER